MHDLEILKQYLDWCYAGECSWTHYMLENKYTDIQNWFRIKNLKDKVDDSKVYKTDWKHEKQYKYEHAPLSSKDKEIVVIQGRKGYFENDKFVLVVDEELDSW